MTSMNTLDPSMSGPEVTETGNAQMTDRRFTSGVRQTRYNIWRKCRLWWVTSLTVATAVVLSLPSGGSVAEAVKSDNSRDSAVTSTGLRNLWRGRLTGPATRIGKNHDLVKDAFRTAIRNANEATVRVYADGRLVALGTVVDDDGYVVTKASEIKGETKCRVKGGRRYPAKVIRVDEALDLALLKLDVKLRPVAFAKGPSPGVGSWVATPVGVNEQPAAVGVVSVESREIRQQKGLLGVHLESTDAGPQILEVFPGSAAEAATIEKGDIVTHVDGKRVLRRQDLIDRISGMRPGTMVRVTLRRDDSEKKVTAVLGRYSELVFGMNDFQEEVTGQLSQRRSGFPSVIQHDGLLQPNQCGGPLVDVEGNVIGINIARAERVATYALTSKAVFGWLKTLQTERLSSRL